MKENIQQNPEDHRCARLYTFVQWTILVFALILLRFGWEYSLLAIIWFGWNIYFYLKGSRIRCIDEWEEGYPQDGIRMMFKSWYVYIPAACLIGYLVYFVL